MMKCRHCRREYSKLRRGFCAGCRRNPYVQACYPRPVPPACPEGRRCRRCRERRANRPRGLCWTCYYAPGVRDLYPSTSKFGRKGVSVSGATGDLPEPVRGPISREQKVALMEQRAMKGLSLFHPEEVQLGSSPQPWRVHEVTVNFGSPERPWHEDVAGVNQ